MSSTDPTRATTPEESSDPDRSPPAVPSAKTPSSPPAAAESRPDAEADTAADSPPAASTDPPPAAPADSPPAASADASPTAPAGASPAAPTGSQATAPGGTPDGTPAGTKTDTPPGTQAVPPAAGSGSGPAPAPRGPVPGRAAGAWAGAGGYPTVRAFGVPAPPSVLRRRWPGPANPAPRPVLGAVIAAAAVAALSIPLTSPGLGWLLSGIAGTAALVVAAWPTRPAETATRAPARGEPFRLGGTRALWALATLALLAVGTVRAAGWLFALCVLTAGVTAALTVVDGRSLPGIILSGVIPPVAFFRSLPWAAKGLTRPSREGGHRIGRTLATLTVSALLLLVFGLLFASADAAFATLLDQVLPDLSAATVVRWVFLFGTVGAALLGAAYVLAAPPDLANLAIGTGRGRLRRFDWALPVLLLDLLFAGFVAVQLTTLFGGADHVLRTAGLTYAEYARSGFWQLLVVSVLTLLVVGAASWWAPRDARADRVLIRVLLGTLTLLSVVIVASALYRMDVYADAYGATRLRLLVAVCELWIGLLFVLVAVAGIRLSGAWLPRVALGTAVLALLGLAVANPDRLIAEHNVARYDRTGRIDVWYLSRLSADAVPALDRLPDPLRRCALAWIAYELPATDDWRETNLGRIAARRILAERPVSASTPPFDEHASASCD